MGLITSPGTDMAETRQVYIRCNNFDRLANHGVPAIARFPGFLSKDACKAGGFYVWERCIDFLADHGEARSR